MLSRTRTAGLGEDPDQGSMLNPKIQNRKVKITVNQVKTDLFEDEDVKNDVSMIHKHTIALGRGRLTHTESVNKLQADEHKHEHEEISALLITKEDQEKLAQRRAEDKELEEEILYMFCPRSGYDIDTAVKKKQIREMTANIFWSSKLAKLLTHGLNSNTLAVRDPKHGLPLGVGPNENKGVKDVVHERLSDSNAYQSEKLETEMKGKL